MGGVATGAGRAAKLGVSGVLWDIGIVGVVSVDMFEERDAEGNETMRLAVLRFVKRVKTRA